MALRKTNGQVLEEKLSEALKTGELPYQANRRAMSLIDQTHDDRRGLKELNVMLAGMGLFISDLEGFGNAARELAKKAKSVR
jgi:hypothetical protein